MSFRLANWMNLLLAGLTLGALPLVQAQSAEPGQQILFSTPEGQIVSNTAVPVACAPQPLDAADWPVAAQLSVFHPQLPQPLLPAPAPIFMPQGMAQTREADPMDPRNTLKLQTPAQIMDVPTMQQIFGLPNSSAVSGLKNPALAQNEGSTNILVSGESSSDEPTWAKMLTANNMDEDAADSAKMGKSHGLLDGFFNGPPSDSVFGNQNKNANGFGLSPGDETAAGQSPFDTSLAGTALANSTPTPSAGLSSGMNSQSPFALPQSSGLATLPQLPAPPSLPGQNYYQPPPAPPSWAPKPAPWLLPVPPPGTMEPRKF